MADAKRYAVIDGAIEEGVMDFLAQANVPYCCLYAEPIQPELVKLAPYLVEVAPEVEAWLELKETPWGLFLISEMSLQKLQQHLRHFLWVTIPEQEKPVLFRFYDPRNIGTMIEVMTPRQLSVFTCQMSKIETGYKGGCREFYFSTTAIPSPADLNIFEVTPLKFTRRQYEKLNVQSQENYINELADFISQLPVSISAVSVNHLAEEYLLFCHSYDITDDHSIRQMVKLLIENNIHDTQSIPDRWLDVLDDNSRPGYNRVQELMTNKGI